MYNKSVYGYKTLHGAYVDDLDEQVKEALLDKWQPLGAQYYDFGEYHQPMVRYE